MEGSQQSNSKQYHRGQAAKNQLHPLPNLRASQHAVSNSVVVLLVCGHNALYVWSSCDI